jgi:prephenate dehydrogenase
MIGLPQIMDFVVTVTTNVGCGLLASWIYDLIRRRGAKAEMNGRELTTNVTRAELIAMIIEQERRNDRNS